MFAISLSITSIAIYISYISVSDICDMNGSWIAPVRCWYLGFLTTYPGTTLVPET